MLQREEIDRHLGELDRDPAGIMGRVPDKRTRAGSGVTARATPFCAEAIASGEYLMERDQIRRRLHSDEADGSALRVDDLVAGKAPIEGHNRAEDLVDALRFRKPADMDVAKLGSASLAVPPWSDDYWAIYLGVLGRRYADPSFPDSDDWKENHAYALANPVGKVLESGREQDIWRLSPSEKYDLLVGDAEGTLTSAMWAEGESYYERDGKVETWMGICHGWAPASYMLARPRRAVTVATPDGRFSLRFFPSDIKALASLLWASASPSTRFIGSRCEEKDPKKDENGRIVSSEAFDINAGAWHLAMVNQVGVARRALVLDATYDYEVWNQPACAYEYHYFNPLKMRFGASLREATVPRSTLTKDRFAAYRSSDYAALVGVAMRARYVVETQPDQSMTDAPERDATHQVDYYYDLELDDSGRILGGEWCLSRHPDMPQSVDGADLHGGRQRRSRPARRPRPPRHGGALGGARLERRLHRAG
jgi:hypothetical protein